MKRDSRIAQLTVSMLVLIGAGGPSEDPRQNGASPPYATARPLPEPVRFGDGVVSTGDMELNSAFTPDGTALYFTKRSPKPQFWSIVTSRFRKGRWTTPEVVEFSGQYNDFDPFVSPDGSKLYFSSSRPVDGRSKGDFDIWVVERLPSGGWSAPTHLDAPVNTDAQEYYPSVTADGTLYFSSTRSGGLGSGDLYRSRLVAGRYGEPENLGPMVNSEYFEGDPYVAPDESYVIFVSYGRPDGLGDGDLYISYHQGAGWTKAVNLGPKINSSALDFCPIVSPDGKYLFFTSERGFADGPRPGRLTYRELTQRIRGPGNGLGDIYQVDIASLGRPR